METNQIIKAIQTRKQRLFSTHETVGSRIKSYRRKHHMTLEEGAKDICSVSYLSKLENNLIKSSPKFFNAFAERFELEESFEEQDQANSVMIEKYLLILSSFEDVCQDDLDMSGDDYRSRLLRLTKASIEKKEETFFALYYHCLEDIPIYSNNELMLFLFNVIHHMFSLTLYHDVCTLYKSLEVMEHELQLRVDYLYVISMLKMRKKVDDHVLNSIKEKIIKKRLLNPLYMISFEFMKYQSYYLEQDIFTLEMQSYDFNPQDQTILDAYHAYYHFDYKRAKYLLEQRHVILKDDTKALYLMCLDGLGLKHKIITALKQPSSHRMLSILMQFLSEKYQKRQTILSYIRDRLNDVYMITHDMMYLDYFYVQAHELFKQGFYYKEALQVTIQYNQLLRGILFGN